MVREEQHNTNEVSRSNTIQRLALAHDVRIRDILLSGNTNYSAKVKEPKSDDKIQPSYSTAINSNIGYSLFIEDSSYQVGLEALLGAHEKIRTMEQYERLMSGTGHGVYESARKSGNGNGSKKSTPKKKSKSPETK